jgi:hypothetical protein
MPISFLCAQVKGETSTTPVSRGKSHNHHPTHTPQQRRINSPRLPLKPPTWSGRTTLLRCGAGRIVLIREYRLVGIIHVIDCVEILVQQQSNGMVQSLARSELPFVARASKMTWARRSGTCCGTCEIVSEIKAGSTEDRACWGYQMSDAV